MVSTVKKPWADLTDIIKESAQSAGLTITELNVNKDTRATKRYMLHYEGAENLPLKIEVSLRDTAQFDEQDVKVVDGIRVYSVERLAELKTEAFIHRIKARDIFDVAFLLDRYPDAVGTETLKKITNRVQEMGIDFLSLTMQQDRILQHYDTEAIILSLDDSISKLQQQNDEEQAYTVMVYPAESDWVYSGMILDIQDGTVIQEATGGLAIGHDKLNKIITSADIGTNVIISYDTDGTIFILHGPRVDHSNEIDR